jgi:hypothetical protein
MDDWREGHGSDQHGLPIGQAEAREDKAGHEHGQPEEKGRPE